VDVLRLVEATEGFTGADLKRLVEDGKTLYAYDRAQERPLRSSTDYFLAAVETVRANKQRYADAESCAVVGPRSSHFPSPGMMAAMMARATKAKRR
jgi:hypothetical protein